MDKLDKETFQQIVKEFEQTKKAGKLTLKRETKLLYNLSGLLGWYALERDPKVKQVIKEMISFSESQNWDTSSYKATFNKIEQKKR